jgi:molybdopterin-guanine dinucleotide biosynthesis protein A
MGCEKGLQRFDGQALAARALQRLRGQTGLQALNANRSPADYAALGAPVWPDAQPDQAWGPLAGVLSGLEHMATPWLMTVPCDVPFFPLDLGSRLSQALQQSDALVATVRAWAPEDEDLLALARGAAPSANPMHRQPVFALLHRSLAPSLGYFLAQGERKVGAWLAGHPTVEVTYDPIQTPWQAFANVNTLSALHTLAGSARPAGES